jgi:hypothetical protein
VILNFFVKSGTAAYPALVAKGWQGLPFDWTDPQEDRADPHLHLTDPPLDETYPFPGWTDSFQSQNDPFRKRTVLCKDWILCCLHGLCKRVFLRNNQRL